MVNVRRWLGRLGLLTLALLPASCTAVPTTRGFPTTGSLNFARSSYHACTASVVSSPTKDLLITAAHCLIGSPVGMTFLPGTVNGSAPYGRWTVTAAYLDPAWRARHDPLRDVAFLRIAPQRVNGSVRTVEQLTGGNQLIATPTNVGPVSVPAYPAGTGGSPITCLATTYRVLAYLAFDCGGYVDGVSGAPWIRGSSVVGVIGGLHQGGCSPSTSYSAPFDSATLALYQRAVKKGAGDVPPAPVSDGC